MTKKEKIIKIATEIFEKNGFFNTKISTIAEEAGIATGSVYLYFDNKDSILEEIFLNSWAVIEIKLQDLLSRDLSSLDMFREYFEYLVIIAVENINLVRMLVREQHFLSSEHMITLKEKVTEIRILLAQMIQKGQKEEIFRKDIDPATAAAVLMGGVWYFFVAKIDIIKKENREEMQRQLFEIFINGLRA